MNFRSIVNHLSYNEITRLDRYYGFIKSYLIQQESKAMKYIETLNSKKSYSSIQMYFQKHRIPFRERFIYLIYYKMGYFEKKDVDEFLNEFDTISFVIREDPLGLTFWNNELLMFDADLCELIKDFENNQGVSIEDIVSPKEYHNDWVKIYEDCVLMYFGKANEFYRSCEDVENLKNYAEYEKSLDVSQPSYIREDNDVSCDACGECPCVCGKNIYI